LAESLTDEAIPFVAQELLGSGMSAHALSPADEDLEPRAVPPAIGAMMFGAAISPAPSIAPVEWCVAQEVA
jgi:hypothetical protein